MSDPSSGDESPGTLCFPVPPDEGLLSRLSVKARAAITTGEFAGALTCAGVAWSVGGDMTLTITALVVGWLLGSIGIATIPGKAGGWRVSATIGLFLFFAIEGGFFYWHFHGSASKEPEKPAATDRPLSQESDEAIISRTRNLAVQLRTFAFRSDQLQSDQVEKQPRIPREGTQEEKGRIFSENNRALQKMDTDRKIEFANRFRPDAISIRDELVFRIKM